MRTRYPSFETLARCARSSASSMEPGWSLAQRGEIRELRPRTPPRITHRSPPPAPPPLFPFPSYVGYLEQRIDERGDGGALREHDQATHEPEHHHHRQQPVFLAHAEKVPQLADDTEHEDLP